MTELCRFFDSATYTEAQFAEFMHRIMNKDGIVKYVLNELAPTQGTGMTVNIGTGEAWAQGAFYQNTEIKAITIEASDPTTPRTDRIVLRISWADNSFNLAVLKGTPSLVDLTQDGSTWELSICKVAVAAGTVTQIYTADITDERFTTYCGVAACNLGEMHIEYDGSLDASANYIHNLADPVAAQDAATKAYAAPLASPTFTGVPAAPTAAAGTSTTQIATCAFVLGGSVFMGATASDTVLKSEGGSYTQTNTTPVYKGCVNVPHKFATRSIFRLKINLGTSTGGGSSTAFCQIRSATGGVYVTWSTDAAYPTAMTPTDVSLMVPGDRFEIWIYNESGATTSCSDFQVCGTEAATTLTW